MFLPRKLVETWLYPLHERAKNQQTVRCFEKMQDRETWQPEQLRGFELEALRRIIRQAYRAPFYRERFDAAGIHPEDIRSLEDLQNLPFLTKDDIRANKDRMVTLPVDQRSRLLPSATGGSTGEPMQFYVDRGQTANGWAACWRARAWWGLNWGDPWFWLWGSPVELNARDAFQHAVKKVRDIAVNRRLLSAFRMDDAVMARYVKRLRRERPRYIYAYSGAAHLLAEYVLAHNIDLSDCAPQVIFATSEMLYPHMRTTIEAAFHCPVSVEYGSRDCGFIAHECPNGGLHIHSDRAYVEILDGDRPAAPGELGEIVITLLDATAMPFLRYRISDLGSLDAGACSCGRPFPLLRSLEGRYDDVLLGRNQKIIHGQSLVYFIRETPGIARFRLFQDEIESLRLQVVRTAPGVPVACDRLVHQLQKQLGYPARVDIQFVDSLPPTQSGKHRSVISAAAKQYFEEKRQAALVSGYSPNRGATVRERCFCPPQTHHTR